MEPSLKNGQIVIASSWSKPHINDIIIIEHDNIEKVKRINKIARDKVYVVGDNPASSTDSRDFGWISKAQIKAKIVWP